MELEKWQSKKFEDIKQIDEFGNEYWLARELQYRIYLKINMVIVRDSLLRCGMTDCSRAGVGGKRGGSQCYLFVRYLRRRVFRPRVTQGAPSFRSEARNLEHNATLLRLQTSYYKRFMLLPNTTGQRPKNLYFRCKKSR